LIFHVNHRIASEVTGYVMGTLPAVINQIGLEPQLASALHVDLDWLPYRANFRDPVLARRAVDAQGAPLEHGEIAIDVSQVEPSRFPGEVTEALKSLRGSSAPPHAERVYLDDFGPLRTSVIWQFNRLFWQRLQDWQLAAGRGSEAVPDDASDANHPQSIDDTVADFWTLLRDLDTRGQLPAEIFALEIGVGTGERAASWLDRFKALDEQCGGSYYSRLKFLLGDYSPATLETALAAVGRHAPLVSVLAVDALNPFKTLSFLRFKILSIHLTNVYDNLPFDEMVLRGGRLYLVEVRPYISAGAVRRLAVELGRTAEQLPAAMKRLLESGPEAVDEDLTKSVGFWRCLWDALRLDERLRALDGGDDAHVPTGLSRSHLEDLLANTPSDARFQLSRGAAESFAHTVPLLHPRGFLQVQDTFITTMDAYLQEFSGPGKIDGSIVSSVNGALLRAVASRAGFDVHFAPFRYRPGSRTSVLYTTPRD
jgi:hypothetical protein